MSEGVTPLIESVKDVFKGGGNKKKKLILFGVAGAAVVGVALYMRSKGGTTLATDTAGTGDDISGSGAAVSSGDLSGLIDGFGSEIDRLDSRIANLGAVGSGYTTVTGDGYVEVPNSDNMAAYSPDAPEMTISTSSEPVAFSPTSEPSNVSYFKSAPAYAAPVESATVPVPAASAAVRPAPVPVQTSPVYHTPAPVYYAPAAETLVVAPKPQNYTPSNVITYVQATPAAIAPTGSSAAATLNNPLAPAGAKMQAAQSVSVKPVQPVATVAASPTVAAAAASNSNIAKFIQTITPKPASISNVAAAQAAMNKYGANLVVDGVWGPKSQAAWDAAQAKSTQGGAISLVKPVVKPISAMQSGYNAYMAGR